MVDRNHHRDDDDDFTKRQERHRKSPSSALERILTPGVTANNIIKTAATGIILGGTIILMTIYGISGARLAGASYLPIATIAASSIAIACVWIFGRPKTEEHYEEEFSKLKSELSKLNTNFESIETKNTDLNKRLSNVELLESFEQKLAMRSLEKASLTRNLDQPPSQHISTPLSEI